MKENFRVNLMQLFDKILKDLPENFEELTKEAISLDIELVLCYGNDKNQYFEDNFSSECLYSGHQTHLYLDGQTRHRTMFGDYREVLKENEVDFQDVLSVPTEEDL
jgi:hypothetical protein